MRCIELGRSPAQLFSDYLAGGLAPTFSQADGRSVIFTQSGREAILLAARLWGISSKDEVLVPAYHCGSEISPLIASGARVSMYRIDAKARIDLADLRARINSRTRLIHIIHYFGRPTDLSELAALCRKHDIKLLEDCALSLFSSNTGRSGDGAIYSFYKTLPACAGGALALRNPPSSTYLVKPPGMQRTARDAASLMKKWVRSFRSPALTARQLHAASESPPIIARDIPNSYYCNPHAIVHGACRQTKGVVQRTNAEAVVRSRRDNYEWLRRRLLDMGNVALLWEEPLAPDSCPLGLPILVRDKDFWCKNLNTLGVPVSSWWSGHHKGLDWTEFPEARSLKAKLILLPVHQMLDRGHIDHIANAVRALAEAAEVTS